MSPKGSGLTGPPPPPPRRAPEPKRTAEILDERTPTHGPWPLQSRVAEDLQGALRWPIERHNKAVIPAGVLQALDLISVKLSRIVCGDFTHADHWDDIAGYATLARRVVTEEDD